MVGAGALAIAAVVTQPSAAGLRLIGATLTIATVLHLMMLLGEYGGRHATAGAAAAAHMITHGRYATAFWAGAVGLAAGSAVLSGFGWVNATVLLLALARLAVQPALLTYESVFVRAGQDVPLS